jgi:hypothetical protein
MATLIDLYAESVFIVYAILTSIASLIMYAASKYIERVYAFYGAWSPQYAKFKKVRDACVPLFAVFAVLQCLPALRVLGHIP